jgi:hypothetical protein
MKRLTLLRLFMLVTFLGNIGWVLAAEDVLTPEMIPMVKYLYAIGLSAWGGFAAYLRRLATATETAKWFIVLLRDFVVSTFAGVAMFLLCMQFSVPPLLIAVIVSVSGYGGSKVLDALLDRGIKKIETS